MDEKNFKTRLKIAKNKLVNDLDVKNQKKGVFLGSAFRLGTELVAAVIVWTIIRFILDGWFGTKPWLIIIFFFMGSIAGVLNVIRAAKKMQQQK